MIGLILTLVLVLVALVLLVAEDLLPTGGALGILAGACLLLVAYQGFAESNVAGLRYLAIEAVVVPVGYGLGITCLRRSPLGRAASLRPPEAGEVGGAHDSAALDRLVSCPGVALTPLRPSGMVELEGRRLDAVAEEGLIGPGARVRVVRVQGGRLVVRVEPGTEL